MTTIPLNWVDYAIIGFVVYHLLDGWQKGLPRLASDLSSFLASLWLAVRFNTHVGRFLTDKIGLPSLWTNALGYVIVALVSQVILSELFGFVVGLLPQKATTWYPSRLVAALVSVVNGLVISALILLVVLALPLRGNMKKDIQASPIARRLVALTDQYGGSVKSSLGDITNEIRRFVTIEPNSKERVSLDVTPKSTDLSVDSVSENMMMTLVNQEREKAGVGLLRVDAAMRDVARSHSKDMFMKRYFSHYDTEGHDASYRMDQAKISYSVVGENLALAPDVDIAHKGLMESEGHRRNILDPQFYRIGIGVIDGGINGKMFTQLFAD